MVIDLKYHLTTIIAIFLALGIGILVGSAMIGDDGIVREQQKLIVQIEDDLQILRNQNNLFKNKVTALEGMLAEQEQFIDLLFQDAIAGQLTGLHGLMVRDLKKTDDENRELLKILRLAGMEVTEFTSLPEDWMGNLDNVTGISGGVEDYGMEQIGNWDLCLLMTQSLPPGLEDVFPKEQIYRPISKQLATKKGIYELITSLRKMNSQMGLMNEEQEVWNDLSPNTSVQ